MSNEIYPLLLPATGGYRNNAMAPLNWSLRQVKRLIVTIVGVTVLGIGIAMIVLPGPAVVVIPLALGILATEFAWAHKVLKIMRERIINASSSRKPKPKGDYYGPG
jgi:uncharacterized protein (TIGR02611 family)